MFIMFIVDVFCYYAKIVYKLTVRRHIYAKSLQLKMAVIALYTWLTSRSSDCARIPVPVKIITNKFVYTLLYAKCDSNFLTVSQLGVNNGNYLVESGRTF